MEQKWQHDWESFVQEVAKLVDTGYGDQALTIRFQSQPVQWSGQLDNKLDGLVAGLQIFLPEVRVRLKNGKTLRADFLFASFHENDAFLWKDVKVGTTIEFVTQIDPGVRPFWGIQIVDLGEDVNRIKVGTNGIRPFFHRSIGRSE